MRSTSAREHDARSGLTNTRVTIRLMRPWLIAAIGPTAETGACSHRSSLETNARFVHAATRFMLDPQNRTVRLTLMAERIREASARLTSREAATAFSRNGTSWSEVTALGDEAYRVRLGGMLRAGWMVGVCAGLAREQLSIQRAHARRLSYETTWIAELHVRSVPGARDPLDIRYVDFAEQSELSAPPAPRLDHFELIESPDHGGTLQVTFTAPDALGLLASLLVAFASISLLPVEMHIDTRGQRAHDCLWLAKVAPNGTKKPTAIELQALNDLLARAASH